ncbi:hypothetical protein NB689_003249 [Xanthomonas sacchari]|nr:hypothetical protein [Xanthomonas sacchari]
MRTTCGLDTCRASSSSWRKRANACGRCASSGRSSLTATSMPNAWSWARYTRPMPPMPSKRLMRKRPASTSPGVRLSCAYRPVAVAASLILAYRRVQQVGAAVAQQVFAAGAHVFQQRTAILGRRREQRPETLHARPQPGQQDQQRGQPGRPAAGEQGAPQRWQFGRIDQVDGALAVVRPQHLACQQAVAGLAQPAAAQHRVVLHRRILEHPAEPVVLVLEEIQLGQHVHAAVAVGHAREHEVVVLAAPPVAGRIRVDVEAAAAAEHLVWRRARHRHDQAVVRAARLDGDVQRFQDRHVAALDLCGGRAQHQMSAMLHPVQQGVAVGLAEHAWVAIQHHAVVRAQAHRLQVQALPRLGTHAVGAQGLAQRVQRVVGGLAAWRQHDLPLGAFVAAEEPGRADADQQQADQEDQRIARAAVHACHRNWRCRSSTSASKALSSGSRPA